MAGVCRVEVEGPLAPFASGIVEFLLAQGYLEESAAILMRLVANLSRWLGERGLGAVDLRGEVIEEFFAGGGGRRCQRRSPRSLSAGRVLLVLVGRDPAERRSQTRAHDSRSRAARSLWPVVCRPAGADTDNDRPIPRACRGLSRDVAP
jgi:hypothetical protein